MNNFFSPSASANSADVLIFLVMMLAIGLVAGLVTVWAVFFRPKHKKQKRKHHRKRHHRQHNPTLAETGGLPPMRAPGEPPPGP